MAVGGVSSTNHMRYWGLASGLDVDEIVRGLIQAERVPLDRLLQRRQLLQWQQDALRDINRRLRELRDMAFNLRLESTFHARSVSVSDETILKATVSSGAALGTHTLTVEQLADGVRFHSSDPLKWDKESLSDVNISFVIKNGEAEAEIRFNGATDNIHSLVAQINRADIGLQAFYDEALDRFFLSSVDTGDAVKVRFEAAGSTRPDDVQRFLAQSLKLVVGSAAHDQGRLVVLGESVVRGKSYEGTNAKIIYNGLELEQQSNEFSIGGVTYNLLKADPGTTVTVRVGQDIDAMVETIKGFVEKYNEVLAEINSALTEKRYHDYPPLTDAQKEEMTEKEIELWEERARSGLLRGDSLLSGIGASLRAAMGGMFGDTGDPFRTLADIGITTGSWDEMGHLHLDEAKLREALRTDADAVAALFRQDGTGQSQGIVRRLTDALERGIERIGQRVGVTGAPVDDSAIGRQIGWINDAIERAEERLARREAYLYRQFTVLETFISQMNTQSLWLAQTFMAGMA